MVSTRTCEVHTPPSDDCCGAPVVSRRNVPMTPAALEPSRSGGGLHHDSSGAQEPASRELQKDVNSRRTSELAVPLSAMICAHAAVPRTSSNTTSTPADRPQPLESPIDDVAVTDLRERLVHVLNLHDDARSSSAGCASTPREETSSNCSSLASLRSASTRSIGDPRPGFPAPLAPALSPLSAAARPQSAASARSRESPPSAASSCEAAGSHVRSGAFARESWGAAAERPWTAAAARSPDGPTAAAAEHSDGSVGDSPTTSNSARSADKSERARGASLVTRVLPSITTSPLGRGMAAAKAEACGSPHVWTPPRADVDARVACAVRIERPGGQLTAGARSEARSALAESLVDLPVRAAHLTPAQPRPPPMPWHDASAIAQNVEDNAFAAYIKACRSSRHGDTAAAKYVHACVDGAVLAASQYSAGCPEPSCTSLLGELERLQTGISASADACTQREGVDAAPSHSAPAAALEFNVEPLAPRSVFEVADLPAMWGTAVAGASATRASPQLDAADRPPSPACDAPLCGADGDVDDVIQRLRARLSDIVHADVRSPSSAKHSAKDADAAPALASEHGELCYDSCLGSGGTLPPWVHASDRSPEWTTPQSGSPARSPAAGSHAQRVWPQALALFRHEDGDDDTDSPSSLGSPAAAAFMRSSGVSTLFSVERLLAQPDPEPLEPFADLSCCSLPSAAQLCPSGQRPAQNESFGSVDYFSAVVPEEPRQQPPTSCRRLSCAELSPSVLDAANLQDAPVDADTVASRRATRVSVPGFATFTAAAVRVAGSSPLSPADSSPFASVGAASPAQTVSVHQAPHEPRSGLAAALGSATLPSGAAPEAEAATPGDVNWGWLEPGSALLGHIPLTCKGVAMGSGRQCDVQALHPVVAGGSALPRSRADELFADVEKRFMDFVSVPDATLAPIHFAVFLDERASAAARAPCAVVESYVADGVAVNGVPVPPRRPVPLSPGDRLLISDGASALLGELVYTYRRDAGAARPPSIAALRAATCNICRRRPAAAVELQPCRHVFCAACLSHWFAALLVRGRSIECPQHCIAPTRIAVADQVRLALAARAGASVPPLPSSPPPPRDLFMSGPAWRDGEGEGEGAHHAGHTSDPLPRGSNDAPRAEAALANSSDELSAAINTALNDASEQSQLAASDAAFAQRADQALSGGAAAATTAPTHINPLVPLMDEMLPLSVEALKGQQLAMALRVIKDAAAPAGAAASLLLVVARLAWSDATMLEELSSLGAIEDVVACMRARPESAEVQCRGCTVLWALVRGDGDLSQGNQWRAARCSAVEAIVAAMRRFRGEALVQVNALQCLAPLCHGNAMMKAHITQVALPTVLEVVRLHLRDPRVQHKGCLLLGMMQVGGDCLNDGVRQLLLQARAPAHLVAALHEHAGRSEDALWAVVFCLAASLQDGQHAAARVAPALLSAGALPALQRAVAQHAAALRREGLPTDDLVASVAAFTLRALALAAARRRRVRQGWLARGLLYVGGALVLRGLLRR